MSSPEGGNHGSGERPERPDAEAFESWTPPPWAGPGYEEKRPQVIDLRGREGLRKRMLREAREGIDAFKRPPGLADDLVPGHYARLAVDSEDGIVPVHKFREHDEPAPPEEVAGRAISPEEYEGIRYGHAPDQREYSDLIRQGTAEYGSDFEGLLTYMSGQPRSPQQFAELLDRAKGHYAKDPKGLIVYLTGLQKVAAAQRSLNHPQFKGEILLPRQQGQDAQTADAAGILQMEINRAWERLESGKGQWTAVDAPPDPPGGPHRPPKGEVGEVKYVRRKKKEAKPDGPDGNGGGEHEEEHGHGHDHGPELPRQLGLRVEQVEEMIHLAIGEELAGNGQTIADLSPQDIGKVFAVLVERGITTAEPKAVIDHNWQLKTPPGKQLMAHLDSVARSALLRAPRLIPDLYNAATAKIPKLNTDNGPGADIALYPVLSDSHGHGHPDMVLAVRRDQPKSQRAGGWLSDGADKQPQIVMLLKTKGGRPAFDEDGKPSEELRVVTDARAIMSIKKAPRTPIVDIPELAPLPEGAPPPPPMHYEGRWDVGRDGKRVFTRLNPGEFEGGQAEVDRLDAPELDEELMAAALAVDGHESRPSLVRPMAGPVQVEAPASVAAAAPEMTAGPERRRRPMLEAHSAADSEKAARRREKEPSGDVYVDDPADGLALVFNGVGSGRGEAVAAGIAAGKFAQALEGDVRADHLPAQLKALATEVDNEIRAEFADTPGRVGATTMAGVKLVDNGHQAAVMWTGSDRVYIVRASDNNLEALTLDDAPTRALPPGQTPRVVQDHMSEIRDQADLQRYKRTNSHAEDLFHVRRKKDIASLGGPKSDEPAEVHLKLVNVEDGDRLVVVSSVVHQNLTDLEIADALQGRSGNSQQAVARLVEAAERRSTDGTLRSQPGDMTAIVMDLHHPEGITGALARSKPPTRRGTAEVPPSPLDELEPVDVNMIGGTGEFVSPEEMNRRNSLEPVPAPSLTTPDAGLQPSSPDDGEEERSSAPLTSKGAWSRPVMPSSGIGRMRGAGSGRPEYSVTRDWQPEDEHTDFSLLMHRIEDSGDNFDVPAAGRMTLPQVRRLVAAATTYRDLEAVEREAFERANQARRDAMVLTETTNRRGEMVYQTRANSTNRTDRETLKIIAERRRELREQQRRPAAEAQVAAAPERGGDSGASAPAAPTAPAASAAAEFAKPSPSERAAAVAEGQEAEHEAAAGSPGGPEAAVAGEVVSGPEVKRGRTELDELKDALREIHDKYSDDPDRRNVELTNIQARVLALFDNPLYRSGGAEEDRRSEQLEFFEDYNRELTECNEQRRLEKEVTDVVLDLTLQLRGLFDQYKGDPRGMRENLPDFEEKARAARADLAKRVGTLQQKPTRTMTRLAAAYDLLYRRVTEIARQPNAKRAVRPPQSPPGEIES